MEAGQSLLTSCAGSRLGKKGWAMVNRGKQRMHELGHGTRDQFADAQANIVYGWIHPR